MELPIIYEDADIVAVDKPSGVMTHPDGHTTDETASDWFAARYPDSREVGETQRLQDGSEIRRPGVVHRLDRETSGVLVFAKTPEAHEFLKKAFHDREVHKTYLAFVYGVPKERKGIIEFSIGRSRKDFRLRSAQPKAKGTLREALTRYEVLSDIGTHSLLKAMPETGRTHQIRVHLKAIHHPVVCDPLYAPNHPCDLGFNRLGLHAYQLDVPLPSGERMIITADLPPDLAGAAKKLGFAFR
ncbi:MAG: RluA family pseudouridine synthase [Candidatus Pacebacteria bacterium]|nr:RluA family pseudouridine synthase [Candidatus Paceibacterota bacterium]